MESRAVNPTFFKSRNTIWRTVSSRDHTHLPSLATEKSRLQTDALSSDSNIGNEVAILHPRGEFFTF